MRFITEMALGADSPYLATVNIATILAAAAWLLYSDIRISMHSMQWSFAKAGALAGLSIAVYFILVSPVTVLSVFLRSKL